MKSFLSRVLRNPATYLWFSVLAAVTAMGTFMSALQAQLMLFLQRVATTSGGQGVYTLTVNDLHRLLSLFVYTTLGLLATIFAFQLVALALLHRKKAGAAGACGGCSGSPAPSLAANDPAA